MVRGGLAQDVEYVAGVLVEPDGEYRLMAHEVKVSRSVPQGLCRQRRGDPRRRGCSAAIWPLVRWRWMYPPMELGWRRVGGGMRGMVGVVKSLNLFELLYKYVLEVGCTSLNPKLKIVHVKHVGTGTKQVYVKI